MIKIELFRTLDVFFYILETLLLVRFIMSLLRIEYKTVVGKLIYELTQPIMDIAELVLDKLRLNRGMFDFSFIASIFIIRIMQFIVFKILFGV